MAGLSSDTTSSESPSSNLSVLVIGHSEAGVQKIFEMVGRPSFDITKYSELEIHINAGNLDPWTDDRLAIILDCFRPNHVIHRPHHLEHIAIVSHGNILFTRHNYTLTSPAVSYDINNHLHKLMANSLTESEKRAQSYKIFSTDKAFARAILNIRDVPLVTFRCAGNGTIEQYFLKEIEHTVALPSGKPVLPSPPPSKRHKSKAESLYRKGTFESQGYKTNFKNPYPLRNIDKKKSLIPGKDALLVDQLSMMQDRLEGMEKQEVIERAICEASKAKSHKAMSWSSTVTNPGSAARMQGRACRKRKAAVLAPQMGSDSEGEWERANNQNDRTIEEMVRIMAQNQDGEDLGMKKKKEGAYSFNGQAAQGAKARNGEWLVLTGKGGLAQLGWKVK